jgi:hydrogenase-1 operon protein HyaF
MPRPSSLPTRVVGEPGPGSPPGDQPSIRFELPKDIATYRPPALPDPGAFAARGPALAVLQGVARALAERLADRAPATIDLGSLAEADRALVTRLLGEGEVVAQVLPSRADDQGLQARESVFAGVWRVLQGAGGRVQRDTIEVGALPQGLLDAARIDARTAPSPAAQRPADTMNAPSVLEELRDRARIWRAGDPPHVVNLTLLPLSDGDRRYLDAQLGAGRVLIHSRGYGHCRIVNTRLPRTWRVTYFNSSDAAILDTLEVAVAPEVACAATQDLEDSSERMAEVLAWLGAS